MLQKFREIISFIQENDLTRIAVFIHQNADPDAIASAVGLKSLLETFIESVKIKIYSSSISTLTEKICSSYDISTYSELDINPEVIFMCDTNNILQLGENFSQLEVFTKNQVPIVIIDHHFHNDFADNAKFAIIDQSFSSASEIVAYIYISLSTPIPPNVATLLLIGIISDSRRFINVSDNIFYVTHELSKYGKYEDALSILTTSLSISERIARIKGVQRAKIHRIEEKIAAASHVSSFESSVARALISTGADLAIVVSKQKPNMCRVSLRCKKRFATQQKMNLGEIANTIANKFGGTGGGHNTAAGINLVNCNDLPKNIEELTEFMLNTVLKMIYS